MLLKITMSWPFKTAARSSVYKTNFLERFFYAHGSYRTETQRRSTQPHV